MPRDLKCSSRLPLDVFGKILDRTVEKTPSDITKSANLSVMTGDMSKHVSSDRDQDEKEKYVIADELVNDTKRKRARLC